jgi:hypothetical protein
MTKIELALANSKESEFDVVTAAAVVIDPTTSRNILIIVNQAAYIPDLAQHESLLHSDQARNHCVFVNDLAKCFCNPEGKPGRLDIGADGCIIPLKHDGRNTSYTSTNQPRRTGTYAKS